MRHSAVLAALAVLAGCQGQPDLLCQGVRVVWPYFELDPSADVSDDPGLQISFSVRTGLLPGSTVALYITDAEETTTFGQEVVADEGGDVAFRAVTIPEGQVTFTIEAQNECGTFRTSRSTYVWDGRGFPRCGIELAEESVERARFSHPVLNAAADSDPETAGFQAHVEIDAGRPDMEVTLFALDLDTGAEETLMLESGDDSVADFALTLHDGRWALRGLCVWPPESLRSSSTTLGYAVDTEVPTCELTEPTSAISAADDLDGDLGNGIQFEVVGSVTGDDVEGERVLFDVGPSAVAGEPVMAGQSAAVATYPGPEPPETQTIRLEVRDWAGNLCSEVRELQ